MRFPGEIVDIKTFDAADGRTYYVEIRRMRGSGRYFPAHELPGQTGMIYSFPTQDTPTRAFNMAVKHIKFHLEDRPGWNNDQDTEA